MTEHASGIVSKRILIKYKYLLSLQLCEDQDMHEKLYKRACNHVFAILTTYMETGTGFNAASNSVILRACK